MVSFRNLFLLAAGAGSFLKADDAAAQAYVVEQIPPDQQKFANARTPVAEQNAADVMIGFINTSFQTISNQAELKQHGPDQKLLAKAALKEFGEAFDKAGMDGAAIVNDAATVVRAENTYFNGFEGAQFAKAVAAEALKSSGILLTVDQVNELSDVRLDPAKMRGMDPVVPYFKSNKGFGHDNNVVDPATVINAYNGNEVSAPSNEKPQTGKPKAKADPYELKASGAVSASQTDFSYDGVPVLRSEIDGQLNPNQLPGKLFSRMMELAETGGVLTAQEQAHLLTAAGDNISLKFISGGKNEVTALMEFNAPGVRKIHTLEVQGIKTK